MSGAEQPNAAPTETQAVVDGAIEALATTGLPCVVVVGNYPAEGSAMSLGRNGNYETYLSLLSGAIAHELQHVDKGAPESDGAS